MPFTTVLSITYVWLFLSHMLQSTDAFPLNFGFTGKGNTSSSQDIAQDLQDQVEAGAMG